MAASRGSVFPPVSPVSLNLGTVSNHMDAVIMCSDWDTDPPNILESDKVMFFALNYMIVISKLDAVWLTGGDRGWFLGESSPKSRSGGWFIFITNTRWANVFCVCFCCYQMTLAYEGRRVRHSKCKTSTQIESALLKTDLSTIFID